MTVLQSISLYFKSGSSDKVYTVSLEESGGGYVVNFSYGRRGSALKAGTKTSTPVDQKKAQAIYDKLVREKTSEGYLPGQSGGTLVAPLDVKVAEWVPQLLNPIDETEVDFYLNSPDWGMQEKHDGENRIVGHSPSMEPFGVNRKGEPVALAQEFAEALDKLGMAAGRQVMAAEDMGSYAAVHDLLLCGQGCRHLPFSERYRMLAELAVDFDGVLWLSPLWTIPEAKRDMYEQLKDNNAEGVVFKLLSALSVPGRPASGGDQLKFKFWKSATFIVTKSNLKASVGVSLYDEEGQLVPVGNVTIPPNHDIPDVGDLVEIRYLYAYKGGSIYQPIYKGRRTDIFPSACTLTQLKFKRERE